MISPKPDIRTLEIDPVKDNWMILACDGIWNFMSSQEVVDYVNLRIGKTPEDKLSNICEEVRKKPELLSGNYLITGLFSSYLSTALPRTLWGTAPGATT